MSLAIIFDMDGTLFQTNNILEISLEDTFDNLRSQNRWIKETPLKKYQEIMGVPLPVVWETLLPDATNEWRESANAFFHERLIANINAGKGALYQNTIELFRYLKSNGHSLFIASNGQTEYLKAIVSYYGLDQWVTETFSIQQIHTQNKTDLVTEIINLHGITNGMVIGDRLSDIQAAKQNNLHSIGCRFDFSQEKELAQADFVIDDLMEIRNVLKGI
ncbi:HAD hydrolase-like protein [Paenisporosarcina quisquiliarum]|uniref:HAD hydrolase-like protein n=1 Tax=Paenisporosarcina quisquiliarum TaxID=365346 RepID=UPI003736C658